MTENENQKLNFYSTFKKMKKAPFKIFVYDQKKKIENFDLPKKPYLTSLHFYSQNANKFHKTLNQLKRAKKLITTRLERKNIISSYKFNEYKNKESYFSKELLTNHKEIKANLKTNKINLNDFPKNNNKMEKKKILKNKKDKVNETKEFNTENGINLNLSCYKSFLEKGIKIEKKRSFNVQPKNSFIRNLKDSKYYELDKQIHLKAKLFHFCRKFKSHIFLFIIVLFLSAFPEKRIREQFIQDLKFFLKEESFGNNNNNNKENEEFGTLFPFKNYLEIVTFSGKILNFWENEKNIFSNDLYKNIKEEKDKILYQMNENQNIIEMLIYKETINIQNLKFFEKESFVKFKESFENENLKLFSKKIYGQLEILFQTYRKFYFDNKFSDNYLSVNEESTKIIESIKLSERINKERKNNLKIHQKEEFESKNYIENDCESQSVTNENKEKGKNVGINIEFSNEIFRNINFNSFEKIESIFKRKTLGNLDFCRLNKGKWLSGIDLAFVEKIEENIKIYFDSV